MEKINIAEILKDCPKGTLLYATVHGEVKFSRITSSEDYPIAVELDSRADFFTEDGRMYPNKGECVLFPSKDQRDWSKFQRPFENGDIVFTLCNSGRAWISIFKKRGAFGLVETYADYAEDGSDFYSGAALCNEVDIDIQRLANEEEKQKLFQAIKDNGYTWDAEEKTLEKLAPNKFDITTLKPFDKVLARDNDSQKWDAELFGFYDNESEDYHFRLVGAIYARYCIPYEGNEHLLGTSDDCSDYYKNW